MNKKVTVDGGDDSLQKTYQTKNQIKDINAKMLRFLKNYYLRGLCISKCRRSDFDLNLRCRFSHLCSPLSFRNRQHLQRLMTEMHRL